MKNLIFDRGRFPISLVLIALFAVGVGWFFHQHNFRGLSPQALDCAQIARNISQGHGFSTSVIQPQVTEAFPALAGRDYVPDLTHAPLYPVVLGAVFAFAGESDRNVVALSLALYVLSAALLFILATRLSANWLLAALSALVFCLLLLELTWAGRLEDLTAFKHAFGESDICEPKAVFHAVEIAGMPRNPVENHTNNLEHFKPLIAASSICNNSKTHVGDTLCGNFHGSVEFRQ